MRFDWERWAVVGPKDDTGLGRQAESIRAVLGIGGQLAPPSERLLDRPLAGPGDRRLDPRCPRDEVRELLRGLQGVLVLERPNWHRELLPLSRELGVRTVCAPNWEWFAARDPLWRHCELFVCCSRFALGVVRRCGWRNAVGVGPWPLPLGRFPARRVGGPARIFVHNGALMDPFDRKGTHDVIRAFRRVGRPDLRLIVHLQREAELRDLDQRVDVRVGNLEEPAELYAEADVAVQPSKIEGVGFLVLEALASGLPVVTTDAPPMNEYVAQRELRVAPRWFKRRAFQTGWIPQAHRRLPRPSDLAAKIAWCAEHDLAGIAAANRAWAEASFDPGRVRREWEEALGR
ncbi:MAG TPA: glycosyltransferase [Vicinamibacteria bacterium]|nr:glycosyltransferase [Vicinamibacteria bacterium]